VAGGLQTGKEREAVAAGGSRRVAARPGEGWQAPTEGDGGAHDFVVALRPTRLDLCVLVLVCGVVVVSAGRRRCSGGGGTEEVKCGGRRT
jgi:hypothetical protein